jgi:cytochrome o ubiquinol oxidase operon protein cyoD
MNANNDAYGDVAPGELEENGGGTAKDILGYVLGLLLAAALTTAAFWVVGTHLIYGPGIPIALITLAIAQMGIHLVFFLHITTDPDNTNNVLALAFGILIVCLVIFGSLWIMHNLNHNMMPMEKLMQMQH